MTLQAGEAIARLGAGAIEVRSVWIDPPRSYRGVTPCAIDLRMTRRAVLEPLSGGLAVTKEPEGTGGMERHVELSLRREAGARMAAATEHFGVMT